MIDRRDFAGLAAAIVGHAGLIAAVYYLLPAEEPPPVIPPEGIQVTLADDIGLVSAAPDPSTEPPAQMDQGDESPEDTGAPEPQPEPEEKPKAETQRPNPDAAKQPPVKSRQNPNSQQKGGRGPGLNLDESLFKGPAREESPGKGEQSQATMTGAAQANILTAIKRQVQPCADRQVIPAPEARQIYAMVQLTLNRDGSLASVRIVGHEGVTDDNRRYVARVDDAVEAIFAGCTPIRGLPPELYDVPRGWRSLKFRYRMNS